MDWFGQGHSSDVTDPNRVVPFGGPTKNSYSHYLGGLLERSGVKECTAVGSMTGAALALVMANDYPHMISQVVLNGLFYFFPDILKRNEGVITKDKNFHPALNGSHLIEDGWLERSYQPAQAGTEATVWLQQRKAIDRIASLPTEWRTMQAFHDANGEPMLSNLTAIAPSQRVLLTFAAYLFDGRAPEGVFLKAKEAAALVAKTIPHATVHWFKDAHMDVMNENASAVVDYLGQWLNSTKRSGQVHVI
jgi:pimeloyl-ACP methyl ester carboxylesterase